MNLKELLEEWKTSIKHYDKVIYDIFKNPTQKEMIEILKQNPPEEKADKNVVRFIIDKKHKNIYVFSSSLLHHYAAGKLDFPYNGKNDGDYIYSFGMVVNGKIYPYADSLPFTAFFRKNKSFVKKYFTLDEGYSEFLNGKIKWI